MTRLPPALVEILPPIVAEPRAPRSRGKNSPFASAASQTVCNTQPACTVIVAPSASISSIAFIRSSEIAMALSLLAPSTRPVLPPQGTTACLKSWQSLRTVETSAVERGRTTAIGVPSLLQPRAFSSASSPSSTAPSLKRCFNCEIRSLIVGSRLAVAACRSLARREGRRQACCRELEVEMSKAMRHRLGARADAELSENGLDMKFHRVKGNREQTSDFLVALAFGHGGQDLDLARREKLRWPRVAGGFEARL